MVQVRWEFIRLGKKGGRGLNIFSTFGTSGTLSVGSTATAGNDRLQAPTSGDKGTWYVRVIALDSDVRMAWGEDPTANSVNSLRVVQGVPETVSVFPGDKVSFIEASAAAPVLLNLTLPENCDFLLIGAKAPHSAAVSPTAIRLELRPGERELSFDDPSVERSQYDGYPTPAANSSEVRTVEYGVTFGQNAPGTADWMYITEHHHWPDSGEYSGPPPLALVFEGTTLKAIRRHTLENPTVTPPASQTLWSKPAPVVQGQLYMIKEEVRFHQTLGRWKVWFDGVLVVDFSGQVGFPDIILPYWMFGIYRDATPGETAVVTFSPKPLITRVNLVANLFSNSDGMHQAPWDSIGGSVSTISAVPCVATGEMFVNVPSNSNNGGRGQYLTLPAGQHTVSFYGKCASGTVPVQIMSNYGQHGSPVFNLTTTEQRFSFTFNAVAGANDVFIYVASVSPLTALIASPQIEAGVTATPYSVT